LNNRLELAFIESFNDKIESQEQINRRTILAKAVGENSWPIEIQEVVIKPIHEVVGKQLSELQLRELTGTTIIAITRAGISTYKLSPDSQLFPGDRLILMGTGEQISKAREFLLKEAADHLKRDNSQFDVLNFCVGSDKNFIGTLLSALDLRQKYGLNVVGIQRKGEKIIDIKSNMELMENDTLLLVGTRSSIGKFRTEFAIE
jgi:CPA2 family monovalent cation:H+ antiporter-2